MTTMMTTTTCGANCWYAKEDACRCSCGGTSHGILLTAGMEQPRRNCTISGTRYVLGAIARFRPASHMQREFGKTLGDEFRKVYSNGYKAPVPTDEKNAPTWRKAATQRQAETWPEVAALVDPQRIWIRPSLVWVREDLAARWDAWQSAFETID